MSWMSGAAPRISARAALSPARSGETSLPVATMRYRGWTMTSGAKSLSSRLSSPMARVWLRAPIAMRAVSSVMLDAPTLFVAQSNVAASPPPRPLRSPRRVGPAESDALRLVLCCVSTVCLLGDLNLGLLGRMRSDPQPPPKQTETEEIVGCERDEHPDAGGSSSPTRWGMGIARWGRDSRVWRGRSVLDYP